MWERAPLGGSTSSVRKRPACPTYLQDHVEGQRLLAALFYTRVLPF